MKQISPLDSHPRPVADYTEAITRITALQAKDSQAINPLCRTQLLTHGQKVEHVIICLHGFTNCPQQFYTLAQSFFDLGYNVLNPRLPHHGLQDRLTHKLADLTVKELIAFTDEVIDIAHGLGECVTLVGMSLGGTLALWAAQHRSDLQRAVAIAPLIAPRNVPRWLLPWLLWLARGLPNFFVWWDQKLKASAPGPRHAYPRFSSHGLAATLRIAKHVESNACKAETQPLAHSVLLMTNAADPALDNAAAKKIINQWKTNGAANIATYEFAESSNLLHDLIDEQQVGQRTDLVYPVLLTLISDAL